MQQDPAGEADEDVTKLVHESMEGLPGASDRLYRVIYGELLGLASQQLRRERRDHTLSPSDLVHEAYFRLVKERRGQWKDRTHFYCIAARTMRRVLLDHARAHAAQKRAGKRERKDSTLVDGRTIHPRFHRLDFLALEEALQEFAQRSPFKAQIVELRFFAGLSIPEVAKALEVHEITVKRALRFAAAWLRSRMVGTEGTA